MPQIPAVIVVAAMVPALAYAALLAALDARRPRPWRVLLSLFLWGAVVVAFCAARMNDLVAAELAGSAGETHARVLVATAAAPVIEEILKASGLVLLLAVRPSLLRSARDGIVNGAWIGLGFDLAENLEYLTLAAVQGGTAGLMRGVWVRGFLGGLKHAVFTGTVGAGLGWARDACTPRARVLVPAGALLVAIAQHAAWNTVASQAITRALCGAAAPQAACRATPADLALFVSVPLIVALFVGPGALALLAIGWRHSAPRSQ
jgi:RsiW-degrading membrane proteinase PrsW (M82 family)